MRKKLISFIILSPFVSSLFAGWVITEKAEQKYSGEGPGTIVTYIQNNIIKTQDGMITTIMDLNKNKITLINHGSKSYWSGSFDDFIKENKNIMEEMKKKMTEGMTPKEKKEFEAMMKPKNKEYSVKTEKTSEKEKIAGYEATKYNVYVNGELKEEIWISDKIDVNKEIDRKKMNDFNKKLTKALDSEAEYEDTPEYEKLTDKGYDLRIIVRSELGIKSKKEVQKIEKKNIPSSEFKTPSGYKKTTISRLLGFEK